MLKNLTRILVVMVVVQEANEASSSRATSTNVPTIGGSEL